MPLLSDRLLAAFAMGALTLAGMLAPGTVQAQAYPSRPVRLIVPLAAGSTADILSRLIGAELQKELGQTFIIDDKPGAGGTIAMAELARSTPDGYTLAFASQGTLVFNSALYAKPGYDALKDFAPIILVGGVSNVMIVPPNSAATSPAEFIAESRRKAVATTFSSGGNGTSHHLSGVLFGQLSGVDLLHVPYKGAPQGIFAVMSGEVGVGFFNTPTVINQIREGKVKALAVTSRERSPLLPQLPTLDESGVKGYEVNTWFGFVAPAGTPAEIVARLHDTIAKIVTLPANRHKLAAQGFELAPTTPSAAFGKRVRDDMEKWPAIIRASGAKVD